MGTDDLHAMGRSRLYGTADRRGLYDATCCVANNVRGNATLRARLHLPDYGGFRPIWSAMASVSSRWMPRANTPDAGPKQTVGGGSHTETD